MTLQAGETRVNFDGDDVTAVFPFEFKTADIAWIVVSIDAESDGIPTNIVELNLDQESAPGGTVTFTGAVPQIGEVLSIERIASLDQLVDYTPFDAFPAQTHEGALDKSMAILQQHEDKLDRALVADITTPPGFTFTLPAPDVGKGLLWNATNDGLENSEDDLNGITGAAQASADASEASAIASAGSASAAAASLVLTNADVVLTGLDVITAAASEAAADGFASDSAASAIESSGFADDSEGTLAEFETIYLGVKAADPPLDNEGNPLITGAQYFNSVTDTMRIYNGVAWDILTGLPAENFPAGTTMPFHQDNAPVDWTKLTDHDNKAFRVTSGPISEGGVAPFTTVFGAVATADHTLVESQMPAHVHTVRIANDFDFTAIRSGDVGATLTFLTGQVGSTGGGGAHLHGVELRVQYIDLILASKD